MEYQQRVAALSRQLGKKEIDLAVLFDPANVRYITGFRLNRATSSILIINSNGSLTFVIARLDYERAKRDCWIEDENILFFPEDTKNYLKVLHQPLRKAETVGIEEKSITHYQLSYLRQICRDTLKLASIENDLSDLRAIKSQEEIEAIRRAAAIADEAMTKVFNMVKKGMTEAEVSSYAEYVMRTEGAEGASFEPFLMSGENAWLPQRLSSQKKLKKGELMILDLGAIYEGYCSDLTRTFGLGDLTRAQEKIFKVALKAQQAAIAAIKPGMIAAKIDAVAREIIQREGYGEYFPHLTGHGVGLCIHELPIIDKGVETPLTSGMVTTIEPGIYLAGVGAARTEDMVLVTDTGYELLTKAERELI